MPFAMIGFTLAYKTIQNNHINNPIWTVLLLVILSMIFARSAAMAFNRYIDQQYDKLNVRTSVREIPAGIISSKNALLFVIINSVLFIATTYFINTICFLLSPVALFIILFYSYTKRFTPLCHLVLGLGLSLAPIGAYLALLGHFALLPILFSCIVFTWVSAFDILYALQDEAFDREHQLKSIPVLLGRKNALLFSRILHTITAIIVLSIALFYLQNILYYIAATLFIGLLIFQHTLVKVNDISKVNLAFGTTNGVASILYATFVILSILLF